MQRKTSDIGKKYHSSLIISLFVSFFEYINKLLHESVILSYFKNYDKILNKYSNSLISEKISSLSKFKFYLLKFKISCADKTQNSFIINCLKDIKTNILNTSLTTYGIFALTYGLFMIFNSAARNTEKIFSLDYSDSFILGIVFCCISLFLIPFRKKTLVSSLNNSKLCSFILFDIFSIDFAKSSCGKAVNYIGFAFVSGIVCGIISAVFSPILIGFIVLVILTLSIIFIKPENGIMLICLTLPFCTSYVLSFLIIVTAISTFFKTIRGKRAFRFNLSSGILLLLLLIAISSCIFSFDSSNAISGITPATLSIVLGFLVIILINSSRLSQKCCKALAFSAILSAIFAIEKTIYTNLFNNEIYDIINIVLNSNISSSFKSSEFFAAFIIALIPIVLIKINVNSRNIVSLLSAIILTMCLVLTSSYYAVIAIVLAFIIQIIIFNRHGIYAFFLLALSIPCFSYLSNFFKIVISKYLPVFYNHKQGLVYEAHYNLPEFLSQFWMCGAGSGSNSVAFASSACSNYYDISGIGGSFLTMLLKIGVPLTIICILLISVFFSRVVSYALNKNSSEEAKSICSAVFTSITALFIYAFFSNYIINLKILSLFFLIASLGTATANSAENDYISPSQVREIMF